MKKSSWVCTIAIQLALCCALFAALNLGQSQKVFRHRRVPENANSRDLHFISVAGGSRPLTHQTRLIRLMESAARVYKAKFVVQISELGEQDPLLRNATQLAPSLKVPWYMTKKGHGLGSFVKHVNLPLEKSLDIVFLGSASIQDTMLLASSNGDGNVQLNWLTRTLKVSYADWRVVVGLHPFSGCGQKKQRPGLLLDILTRYEVDLYLSKQGSTSFAPRDDVACFSIPRPSKNKPHAVARSAPSGTKSQMPDGFFLHRVSALEVVSYFVNTTGQVIDRNIVRKRGKDVM